MAVRSNMAGVQAWGETLPEGCYHFRVDRIQDDGGNTVLFFLKCQTEPFVGRGVREQFDMDNDMALSKLKAYYKAAGYEIGPDGSHDPETVSGMEFYAVVKHNIGKNDQKTYANIAPWSITSLEQGPAQVLGPAA